MPQQNTTPRFRPVIRVFVSSTFSDLKPERNALQAQVFPRLEQLCAQNGFQFQAIDLRWGVSSEAGLDHRTMRICFDELRRAQDISPEPNFLVLLGNRYGWRPLPEEISHAEFEQLAAKADSGGETQTPIPGAHGKTARQVLCDWYRCDENVLVPDPPETSPYRAPLNYLLQPRTQNLGDGRDYKHRKDDPTRDTQDWIDVQQVLWRIINAAFPATALDHRFDLDWTQHVADVNDRQQPQRAIPQIARFQASATEQEIWCGALSAVNAERHVIACYREIANQKDFSPTELNDFFDMMDKMLDEASAKQQSDLKKAIDRRLGKKAFVPIPFSRLKRENGKVIVDASTEDIQKFCDSVENQLRPIIEHQIEEYWNKTAQASAERAARELKIEQDEHERFGRERGGAKSFVGRQTELQAIREYLQNDSLWPLVVHGSSGCGKTALLARAAEEIQKSEVSGQKPEVIVRFIGVTPRSSDIRSLLGSLCQELRLRHPREGEVATDIKVLNEELQEHFKSATPERPLILFLDALDQLSDTDNGRLLNWIPTGQLPGHVKLVVSCLSDRAGSDPAGQPFAELTRRQLPANNLINLDALSEEDASTLLFKNWLHQAGRKVSDQQRGRIEQILKSKECRQPIYLKLLFEESRLWRSYDAAPELGESVSAILGQLFERLGQPANHGRLLVERVLGYLAASRHGLAENEILEVLFVDREYKAALDQATEQTRHELPASATRIPIAIWSRLRFDLAPYLTERAAPGANVLTFYHRQVAEWVQEHFVKASGQSWQPHRRLADYFTACAKGIAEEWETDSVRGFAECVYQLIQAGQHEQAARLLSNFPFLLHKLRVGLLEGVFEDYELLRREAPASVVKQMEVWADFFREKAHILRRGNDEWPAHKILLQLAVEHADDSPLSALAEQWIKVGHCDWEWFRCLLREPKVAPDTCRLIFEGHSDGVNGALLLPEGQILSWSRDYTLRLWDRQSGRCLHTLQGHTDAINGVLLLPNGRILSWSDDKTLRLWDGQNGLCLHTLLGHTGAVSNALILPDGQILSWSPDHTLRLWDAQNGQCLQTLHGHTGAISNVLALCDGRILSWSADRTLRLWNEQNGQCLHTLEGHTGPVSAALLLPDGRILSWSWDLTLRLWDQQSGECLQTLQGHSFRIGGVLLMRVSSILSWSEDHNLRLWDGQSGQCLHTLQGHTRDVRGALLLPKDHVLSWSADGTLRLWDTQSGQTQPTLESHTNAVTGLLTLSDDQIVSWAEGDKSLRLWDGQSGLCLHRLQGHTGAVSGVLILPDGRILSWSSDQTLRLWDGRNGQCLRTLQGHTSLIMGVLLVPDGRILSWADDLTLRLWDGQSGKCLHALHGHTFRIGGVLLLPDGRILSWAQDLSLRLWDGNNGQCLHLLKGHTDRINDALLLPDGKILSWSSDGTLRVWDGQSGQCLHTLEGHTGDVIGVSILPEGRLLSWSWEDETYGYWDGQSGQCLEMVPKNQVAVKHPDWLHVRFKATYSEGVVREWFLASSVRTAELRHKGLLDPVAVWQANTRIGCNRLLHDGTSVVGLSSGQVCILKLYQGNRRVSLAEAEEILSVSSAKSMGRFFRLWEPS